MRTSQLELFNETPVRLDAPKASNPILGYVRTYEKTILLTMGFVITGAVAFSLGVEKGKRIGMNSMQPFDIATQATSFQSNPSVVAARVRPRSAPVANTPTSPQKQESLPLQRTGEGIQTYTIQLASYQTRSYAQKEAEVLKKRGFIPLVVSKGKYTVLCVGSFSDKESAQSLLTKLKKQYQDCFMRRL